MPNFARFLRLCCVLSLLFCSQLAAAFDPEILFLTWTKDPLRSMTVVWLEPVENDRHDFLYIAAESGPDGGIWRRVEGARSTVLPDKKQRHHVLEIEQLEPGSSYQLRFVEDGPSYRFRTAPANADASVRFAVGGDVYYYNPEVGRCHEMNVAVARTDPLFAVLGGDIAYSTDKLGLFGDQPERWYGFLKLYKQDMVTEDGYLIPLIPAIGNHDTLGRYGQPHTSAPYFYALFPFPGIPGYGTLEFGNYLSLVVLDSGHTNEVGGRQTAWLEEALQRNSYFTHRFAVYHVPAYPSRTRKLQKQTAEIREHWVPLFDEFRLHAAFEHHEHTYKRTFPLRYEALDEEGVLYLGDGSWGVIPRQPFEPEEIWYLAATARTNHVVIVTIDASGRLYQAMDENGVVFDSVEQELR